MRRSLAAELSSRSEAWQELGASARALQLSRQEVAEREAEFRTFAAESGQEATEHIRALTEALQVSSRSLDTSRLVNFCRSLGGRHEEQSARLLTARDALERHEADAQSKQQQATLDRLFACFRENLLLEPWAQALVCQVCLEPLSALVDPKIPCHDATTYLAHIRSPCKSSVCVFCWSQIMGFSAPLPSGRMRCPICRCESPAPSRAQEAWSVNAPLLRMADDCLQRELQGFVETFGLQPPVLRCCWCQESQTGLWNLYRHAEDCQAQRAAAV